MRKKRKKRYPSAWLRPVRRKRRVKVLYKDRRDRRRRDRIIDKMT